VTLVWFVVWLIADSIGDHAPLLTDPVNIWTGSLILVVALDLARQHARIPRGSSGGASDG
jgi:hypothetical protein